MKIFDKIKNIDASPAGRAAARVIKPKTAAITQKLRKNLPKLKSGLKTSASKLKDIAITTGSLALSATSLIGKTAVKVGKGAIGLGATGAGIAASMLGGSVATTPSSTRDAERVIDASRDVEPISQKDSIGDEEKGDLSSAPSISSVDTDLNFYNEVLKYLRNINNNVDDLRLFIPKTIEDFKLQLEESQYEKVSGKKSRQKKSKDEDEEEKSNLMDLLSGLGLLGLAAFPDAMEKISDTYNSLVTKVSDGFSEVSDAINAISSGIEDTVSDAKEVIEDNSAETSLVTMLSIAGFIGSFSTRAGIAAATAGLIGYGPAKIFEILTEQSAEKSSELSKNKADADKLRKNIITSSLYSSGLLPAAIAPSDIESWVNQLPPSERDKLFTLLTVYQTTPVPEIGQRILDITDQLVAAKMYGEKEGVSLEPRIDSSSSPLTMDEMKGALPAAYSQRNVGEIISTSTIELDAANEIDLTSQIYIDGTSNNQIPSSKTKNPDISEVPEPNSTVSIHGLINGRIPHTNQLLLTE